MALKKAIIIDGAQLEYWKLAGFSIATTEREARIVMDGYISEEYYRNGGKAGKQLNAVITNQVKAEQRTEVIPNPETGEPENHEIVSPVEYPYFEQFNTLRLEIGIEKAAYEYIRTLPEFLDAVNA